MQALRNALELPSENTSEMPTGGSIVRLNTIRSSPSIRCIEAKLIERPLWPQRLR
jgi:hypothetical protein